MPRPAGRLDSDSVTWRGSKRNASKSTGSAGVPPAGLNEPASYLWIRVSFCRSGFSQAHAGETPNAAYFMHKGTPERALTVPKSWIDAGPRAGAPALRLSRQLYITSLVFLDSYSSAGTDDYRIRSRIPLHGVGSGWCGVSMLIKPERAPG